MKGGNAQFLQHVIVLQTKYIITLYAQITCAHILIISIHYLFNVTNTHLDVEVYMNN